MCLGLNSQGYMDLKWYKAMPWGVCSQGGHPGSPVSSPGTPPWFLSFLSHRGPPALQPWHSSLDPVLFPIRAPLLLRGIYWLSSPSPQVPIPSSTRRAFIPSFWLGGFSSKYQHTIDPFIFTPYSNFLCGLTLFKVLYPPPPLPR